MLYFNRLVDNSMRWVFVAIAGRQNPEASSFLIRVPVITAYVQGVSPKALVGHLDRSFEHRDAIRPSKAGKRSKTMSATILQFTPKEALADVAVDCGFHISKLDKRGFVLIDACVSMSLAVKFMGLLAQYGEADTAPCPAARIRSHGPQFSFDMIELGEGGNLLIEACIPQALAFEFRDIRANAASRAA